VFGKKPRRGKGKAGAPAHDDLVRREFTAPSPNLLWLTDITEHWTGDGRLYVCAVNNVWSNRIVGYSIAERMTSQLAVDVLESAVARRAVTGGKVAGCKVHEDRGVNFEAGSFSSRQPWRTADHVEIATLEWVDWFHHQRPYEHCGDVPPAELEAANYRQKGARQNAEFSISKSPDTPSGFTLSWAGSADDGQVELGGRDRRAVPG
jgi:transposase InsO family protein